MVSGAERRAKEHSLLQRVVGIQMLTFKFTQAVNAVGHAPDPGVNGGTEEREVDLGRLDRFAERSRRYIR